MKPDILKQIDKIRELPTLPSIVFEVTRMLQDLSVSAEKLGEVIEADQTMALKLLKLVNSSFYGFQFKISSIKEAIIILGVNTVGHVVLSISIINSFSLQKNHKEFNIQDFWKHGVSVATISKFLADKTDTTLSSDCFTGGLIHDVGKLILAEYFPEHFEKIWCTSVENAISFHEAEIMLDSIDHAEMGSYLALKWFLPRSLVSAIGSHHCVFFSDQKTASIIRMADLIANTCQKNEEGKFELPMSFSVVPSFLQDQMQTLSEWYPGLQKKIESTCQLFLETSG